MPSTTRVTASRRLATGLAALAATTSLVASPALASGSGGGVSSSGQCSTVSGWTLQADASGGQIAVRADVFIRELNTTWKWKLLDNGRRFARGTGITDKERHDLAYFEVRRTTADQQGSDVIRFRASRPATGEVCRGSLTL